MSHVRAARCMFVEDLMAFSAGDSVPAPSIHSDSIYASRLSSVQCPETSTSSLRKPKAYLSIAGLIISPSARLLAL